MKEQLNPFQRYWKNRQQKRILEQRRYEAMSSGQKLFSWIKTLVNAILVVTIINGLALASMFVPTPSMESTVLEGENLFVNKFIFGPSTPQIIPIINLPLPFYKLPPLRDPKQGDIIVFIFPGDRDQVKSDEFQYYLKRCIAVSGDTLQVIGDSVYVNGKRFPLPEMGQHVPWLRNPYPDDKYRTFPPGREFTRSNYGPIRIPKKGDVIPLSQDNYEQWVTFIRREGHKTELHDTDVLIDGAAQKSYTVERDYVFGMGDNRWNSTDSRYFGFIPKESVVGTPMIVYWSMENRNPDGSEIPVLKRFAHIRWKRLGKIINN